MIGVLVTLIISNILIILYLIFVTNKKLFIEIDKETTFSNNTLVGYVVSICRKDYYGTTIIYSINIRFRNKKKIEIKEEVCMLINGSAQNRTHTLNVKFSWLKTIEEVNQFEKDYSIVDEKLVKELVNEFKLKNKINN